MIQDLLNAFETYYYISVKCKEENLENVLPDNHRDDLMSFEDIWKEERTKSAMDPSTGDFKGGTLNHIIRELTNEDSFGKSQSENTV